MPDDPADGSLAARPGGSTGTGRHGRAAYYGSKSVSFAAPGGEAGQAGLGILLASTPDNYVYGYGTSYAAPHVSGLIALVLSAAPTITAQGAIDLLARTAASIDDENPSYAGQLGAGLVDAHAALVLALGSAEGEVSVPIVGGPDSDDDRGAVDGIEAPPPSSTVGTNINAATIEELADLPMLGMWSASRIVAHRNSSGPYATIWDLTASGGVDSWTVEQMADLLVAGPSALPNQGGVAPSSSEQPLGGGGSAFTGSGRLDINLATVSELSRLPLVGSWSAARIIANRAEHGRFHDVDDLVRTGVLDRWAIDQLRPLVTTGG